MIYAPIIIPTLCRYEHFVRCIESLKKNSWANYTDVYIGLDYPKNESHREGYEKIKIYLEGDFSEFNSFTVLKAKKNLGAGKNTKRLLRACFKHHDRYIYSEDDMEYSPNFIQYMDEALEKYEDDDSVLAVTGYSYPVEWVADSSCTVVKQNFICSTWGRALWRSKYKKMLRYLRRYGLSRDFAKAFKAGLFSKMLDPAIIEYTSMVADGWGTPKSFLNTSTDISARIYLAVKGKYTVMPLVSKVRNHGFDGSGLYCQGIEYNSSEKLSAHNYPFAQQPIDTADSFELIEDTAFDMNINRSMLNAFEAADQDQLASALKKAELYSKKGSMYGAVQGIWNIIKRIFSKLLRK